ncbi:MAG: hypothetical protein ABIS01_12065, partial [Ferruginibacter sp.]
VILFELLSGTVPFPLKDNGESARNAVLVAQLDRLPPNLLSLRQQHLPEWWSREKKALEMQVPQWLIEMIYKCLEKKPADRFANGIELHEYIVQNSILAAGNIEWGAGRIANLEQENEKLVNDKKTLEQRLVSYEKIRASINTPIENEVQNTTTRKIKFFAGKNLLIFVLLLVITGFIVVVFSMQKSAASQKNNVIDTSSLSSINTSNEENSQLKKAKDFLLNGRVEEARLIYKSLAIQEIPEAMYEYANITLLNNNDKTSCDEAVQFLDRAALKGFVPAQRTLGFLYAFGSDSMALKQRGYQRCNLTYDIPRGSKLLMEATLQGDTTAGNLLDELNLKYGMQ